MFHDVVQRLFYHKQNVVAQLRGHGLFWQRVRHVQAAANLGQAQKFLGLIPADVGRPLTNINPPVEVPDLQSLVLQVMATSAQVDREFADRQGGRYQVRILPYRTLDNKIDGAVITFVDISNRALGESG